MNQEKEMKRTIEDNGTDKLKVMYAEGFISLKDAFAIASHSKDQQTFLYPADALANYRAKHPEEDCF